MMESKLKDSAISLFIMCIIISIFAGIFVHQRNVLKEELAVAKDTTIKLQEQYEFERSRADGLSTFLAHKQQELKMANMTIEDLKSEKYELIYIGKFKLTYYCDERHPHICGGSGVTASGEPTQVGVTVAVDKNVIPLGTKMYIEGVGFMEAQDTGGAVIGNHIDILVEDHYTAEQLGVQNGGIWILIEK